MVQAILHLIGDDSTVIAIETKFSEEEMVYIISQMIEELNINNVVWSDEMIIEQLVKDEVITIIDEKEGPLIYSIELS